MIQRRIPFFGKILSGIPMTLFVIIVLFSMVLRIHMISTSMPYPNLWDEGLMTLNAQRVLQDADFTPKQYYYPPFTVYLTAVGFTFGFLQSAAKLELKRTDEIGSVHYPFYTHPRVVWPAKLLFAGFSVLAIFLFGLLAYRVMEKKELLILTPLILSLSNIYFFYSTNHINCDILGVFSATLLMYVLYIYRLKDTYWYKGFLPGILAGLVISSKYHLVLAIIYAFLMIGLFSKKDRILKCCLAFVIMILTFVALNPVIITDYNHFLNSLGYLLYDYNLGKPYITIKPGFELLGHSLTEILLDFGYPTVIFALLGLWVLTKKGWKDFVALIFLPLLLLIHMSTQKTFAMRNILLVFLFYGFLCSCGLSYIIFIIRGYISRFEDPRRRLGTNIAGIIVLVLLLMLVFPLDNYAKWITAKPDSRNQVVAWIKDNVPKQSTIFVPDEITMDVHQLKHSYDVVKLKMGSFDIEKFLAAKHKMNNPYVIMPFMCYTENRHRQAREKDYQERAYNINRFNQYLHIEKHFPGRYRTQSVWRPYVEMVVEGDTHQEEKTSGEYSTGCVFVDEAEPNFAGHSELSIGKLILPGKEE